MRKGDTGAGIDRRLSELSDRAAEAGILLDFDGTLSDIVSRPHLARLREGAARELARLARGYALVAVVSGRPGDELPRLVGVDGLLYVGAYGVEDCRHEDRRLECKQQKGQGRDEDFGGPRRSWLPWGKIFAARSNSEGANEARNAKTGI